MILNYSNFFYQLKKINYFESKSKIAVSVSGGVDSIVLVFLLSRWAIVNKHNITAIIIDHKLRPESSIEAQNVSNYLSKYNINNKILIWKHSKNLSSSIQKKARLARLNILSNFCNKNNIIHLFMGHHYDDNLETFILRKISGSNIQGLNAIKILSLYKNIQIIRPLLNFTKKEIIKFAKKNSLKWFEDPSNKNLAFSRSKVRKFIFKNNILRKNIIIEYKKNTLLHDDYIEMIYSNLSIITLNVSYKSIEIDKRLFCQLPSPIGLKILEILVKYVRRNEKYFKFQKLKLIYNNLITKNGQYRSQNAFFHSIPNKIIIFAPK